MEFQKRRMSTKIDQMLNSMPKQVPALPTTRMLKKQILTLWTRQWLQIVEYPNKSHRAGDSGIKNIVMTNRFTEGVPTETRNACYVVEFTMTTRER